VVATLHSDVVFQLGSARLQPSATAALTRLVLELKTATNVSVSGYTDSTGPETINMPLSRARARAVAQWIVSNAGVPATLVSARGFGPADPVASNATEQGRALNRRVTITIETR
jgi:outer membrane protein OmpA-like peptidoglycan-associated protein